MAVYGIMRVEKRGRSAVAGLQREANRRPEDHQRGIDFDSSDIDWTQTEYNTHLIEAANWNKEITRQIEGAGLKARKNSVVFLDGVYTASPEWFDTHTPLEIMEFFRDCLEFHIREYCFGDRSRLINAVVHLDEATPHLHVASVPIYRDGKGAHLSAKNIMGNIHDYRARQDRFFEEVTRGKGLARGEQNVPAEWKRHITKREWQNAKLEEDNEKLSLKNRRLVHQQGQLVQDIEKLRDDYYQHSDLIRHLLATEDVLEEAKRIIEEREEQERQAKSDHLSDEQIERNRQIARAAAILNDPQLLSHLGVNGGGKGH